MGFSFRGNWTGERDKPLDVKKGDFFFKWSNIETHLIKKKQI